MPCRVSSCRAPAAAAVRRQACDPRVTRLTALVLVALLGGGRTVSATNLAPPLTLTHPEQKPATRFGCAVATDGTRVLVGACLDDVGGQDVGSAFLFDAAGSKLRTLRAKPPLAGMQLGFAVAIAGDDPVVGTPHYPNGYPHSGVVVVFNTDQGFAIFDAAPQSGAYFGAALAASGTNLAIGAPYRDNSAGGAVLVSHTGTLLRTFANPDPTALVAGNTDRFDAFGKAIAADAAHVVVGAPFEPTDAKNAGAAYVYDAATGALVTTLRSPHPIANDHFGAAVAIDGPYVLVGAPDDDFDSAAGGMAYVFDTVAGGAPVRVLTNPRHTTDAAFGSAVGFLNGAFVVGAPREDAGAADAGSVYVFDPNDPATVVTVDNPSPAPSEKFGEVLAAHDARLVVSATYHTVDGSAGSGAAYVYVDLGGEASTTTTAAGTTTTTSTTTTTVTTATTTTSTTESTSSTGTESTTTLVTSSSTAPSTSALSTTTTAGVSSTIANVSTTTIATTTTTTTAKTPGCETAADCVPPDTCTVVSCDAGVCVFEQTADGLARVGCALDALAAAIHGASLGDLGGPRTAVRLERQQAAAAAAVRAAGAQRGRKRLRRLKRAERVTLRLLEIVRQGDADGRLAGDVALRLRALAANLVQQLAYARALLSA